MLRVEPSRHGFTWWPLGPTLAGFGLLTLTVVGALLQSDVTVVASLTIGAFAWAGAGWRRVSRDGEVIVVRSAFRKHKVPVDGSRVGAMQGGSGRVPHFDVLLQRRSEPSLPLARYSAYGLHRAIRSTRRIAQALGIRVDEASLRPLEAHHAEAVRLSRGSWRWMAIVLAVMVPVGIAARIAAESIHASVVISCPGGETHLDGATIRGDMEMTYEPGVYTFEFHPHDGAVWSQRIELVAGTTTEVDCRARPAGDGPPVTGPARR